MSAQPAHICKTCVYYSELPRTAKRSDDASIIVWIHKCDAAGRITCPDMCGCSLWKERRPCQRASVGQ